MRASLAIGDFSQATQLSIKTLRYYHRVGLLEPADVDLQTGHRRYTVEQIPAAQVIRRFRTLDMPVDVIKAVMNTGDIDTRTALIADHLARTEEALDQTRQAVASLRELLQPSAGEGAVQVEHRSVPAVAAAAVRAVIDLADATPWYEGAFGELYATLAAQRLTPSAVGGGIYASDLFAYERGEATVFVPCAGAIRPTGRVEPVTVPGVELAVVVHAGPHRGIDRAYGALGAYVAEHALAVEGPIREYYLKGRHETADEAAWRTEIGWPIFRTAAPA